MHLKLNTLSIGTIALTLIAANAHPQTVGAYYNGGGILTTNGNSLGWWFEVTDPVTLTHLGLYDHGAPGLAESHEVGIFLHSNPGTALGVVTVPSGTSAMLVEGTRFVELSTPLSLQTGVAYYMLANNWQTDQLVVEGLSGNAISYNGFVIQRGTCGEGNNNIFNPNIQITEGGELLGPNFMIEGVPEPSSVVGLAMAAGVFALARRRRRQRSRS